MVAAWLSLASPGSAFAGGHALSPAQAELVREIVKQFILTNPKIVLQALETLEVKERLSEADRIQGAIKTHSTDIFDDPASPVGGNPRGDVTIVEFFDYRCPYCKKVHPDMQKLVKEDGNIRIVYKEWPILGPASVEAARAALAAQRQGKYQALHNAFMEARGTLDGPAIMQIVKSAGLDTEKLKRDVRDLEKDAAAVFGRSEELARALKLNGTPAFVIGDILLPGAVSIDSLKQVVADVRQRAKQ